VGVLVGVSVGVVVLVGILVGVGVDVAGVPITSKKPLIFQLFPTKI
jgi:hypothetical protein